MMNIFRLVGDLMHLASIIILLLKIRKSKSASGISFKTQLLYLIVFVTRYLDIFMNTSLYLIVMKLLYISTSAYILYLMRKLQHTWNAQQDTFPMYYLLILSAVLAILFHEELTLLELLWSFSEWLEAFAILPQLTILQQTGECETITSHYLFALGIYRALYIPNWIYKYVYGQKVHLISVLAGCIQTGLYTDFFYVYYHRYLLLI